MRDAIRRYVRSTWLVVKASHWININASPLFIFLASAGLMPRTVVVVSGQSLRGGLVDRRDKPGVKLSKTASWEKTLEDFARTIGDGKLKPLLHSSHVVVRLGVEGAILCTRATGGADAPTIAADLVFDRDKIEGEYAPTEQFGDLPGLTTVFAAALVKRLDALLATTSDSDGDVSLSGQLTRTLSESLPYALQCTRRYFDHGYGPDVRTVAKIERLQFAPIQIFSEVPVERFRNDGLHGFGKFSTEDLVGVCNDPSWSILSRNLNVPGCTPNESEDNQRSVRSNLADDEDLTAFRRATNSLRLGRAIVRCGAERAFESHDVQFPFAKFGPKGEVLSVDRREIEGFRSIQATIREYLRHPERTAPISIAVFGPPGSGKSFGVKQIVSGVASKKVRSFVFNLAQFERFEEVSRLLLVARDAVLEDELPLVFFDEFDATKDRVPLGWLKYFLAPMQDGRFQHDSQMLGIGKCIFVFAGGIASTYAQFIEEKTWSEQADPGVARAVFRSAKGPDFQSRLRGFLDIAGINPMTQAALSADEAANRDPYAFDDFSFVLRRAILIRQFIEDGEQRARPSLLNVDGVAEMDPDVLDAMLLANEYRFGVRSLQALFQMSSTFGQPAFTKTALPSREQCLMHVDESFMFILRRSYPRLRSRIIEETLKRQESVAE